MQCSKHSIWSKGLSSGFNKHNVVYYSFWKSFWCRCWHEAFFQIQNSHVWFEKTRLMHSCIYEALLQRNCHKKKKCYGFSRWFRLICGFINSGLENLCKVYDSSKANFFLLFTQKYLLISLTKGALLNKRYTSNHIFLIFKIIICSVLLFRVSLQKFPQNYWNLWLSPTHLKLNAW